MYCWGHGLPQLFSRCAAVKQISWFRFQSRVKPGWRVHLGSSHGNLRTWQPEIHGNTLYMAIFMVIQ